MLSNVVDGIVNGVLVGAVQLPQPARAQTASATKRVCFRRSISTLSREWREESLRLSERLAERQKILMEHVLPLRRAGWRLVRENNNWLVDYDLSQLFHPLDSNFSTRHTAMLRFKNSTCELFFPEGDPPCMLFVDGTPISVAGLAQTEIEVALLQRQLSLISENLFRRLSNLSAEDGGLTVAFEGAFSIKVLRQSVALVHFSLRPLPPSSSTFVKDTVDYEQTIELIRRMLQYYLKGQSFGLAELFT